MIPDPNEFPSAQDRQSRIGQSGAMHDSESHAEGRVARSIERETAKLPSDTFLWLAVGAMGTSAALQVAGSRQLSLFFGQWAPAFLLFGVYNKLVKQLGSDRLDAEYGE